MADETKYWIGKTTDLLGHIYYRLRSDPITTDGVEVIEKDLTYEKAIERQTFYQNISKGYNDKIDAAPSAKTIKADVTKQLLEREKNKKLGYWEDYYSGCDVGVFIGDIWVDDIITIQYNLTNNKSPIYGYMSEQFDAVARGTVIVQGQFAIAFKETGYLTTILENYKKKIGHITTVEELLESERGSAEFAFTEAESGTPARPDKWGYLNMPYGNIIGKGFDVIITYGDVDEEYRGGTIEKLNDIHITSISKVCEPSGDPIAEMYSFFARVCNENLPTRLFGVKNNIEEVEDSLRKTASKSPAQVANDKLKLENNKKPLSDDDSNKWENFKSWLLD